MNTTTISLDTALAPWQGWPGLWNGDLPQGRARELARTFEADGAPRRGGGRDGCGSADAASTASFERR